MNTINEEEIYDRMYHMAFLLLGNYHDAWDLTQEVFCELEKGRKKWEQADSKWAWACGVFHRQRKKFFRLRQTRETALIMDKADTSTSPDRKTMVREELQKTFDAIKSLGEEQAEALVLFSLEKISIKEIAQIQKVSEGTVKWRIFEARRKVTQMVMTHENK